MEHLTTVIYPLSLHDALPISLERAVSDLPPQIVRLFRFARRAAFAADCQRVGLHLEIDVFRVHSRQHHLAMKLLSILVNEGLDGGAESSRRHRVFFLSRGPAQEAIEDLIEIPAEIKQILEEIIARNKTCHNGLLG